MKPVKTKRDAPTEVPPAGAPRWYWFAGAFAFFFLLLEIYWPSIRGPFVFDDEYLPFRDPGFLQTGVKSLNPAVRPFLNISYWLNLRLFGMEDTFNFHLTNVLLHFANGILIFLTVRKLLQLSGVDIEKTKWLAALSSAIFLFHPVNSEAVAYIAGRSESFSLLWFLSAYTVFLYKRAGGITWAPAAAILLLFGAAFLSKEHTAVLPALLLLTDICFPETKPIDTIKRNWRLYAPMVIFGALGLAVVWKVLTAAQSAGFRMKDLPWHDYFYTQWRAIWIYLRLFLFPFGLNADYEFPISRSPIDHGAIFGLLGLLALLGTSFFYRRRFPLAFFGILIFFLLLAPTSSIVPIKDPVAERRLYLPFIGLLLVVCDLIRNLNLTRTLQWTILVVLSLGYSTLTHQRSQVWADPVALWQDTTEKSPGNPRARFQLAMAHYERGQCDVAVQKFAEAEKVSAKKDHSLYLDWGLAYSCLEQHPQSLEKFRQAAAIEKTGHVQSLIGMALAKMNQPGAALVELNEAAKLEPGYDVTYVNRGHVYMMLNELNLAEADYRQALALNPASEAATQALSNLARRRGSTR